MTKKEAIRDRQAERSATITDVATMAGVGVGTVSRVINNAPFVSPATAALVKKAVADLGYEPPARDRRHHRRLQKSGKNQQPLQNIMLLLVGTQTLRWILDNAPVYSYVLDGVQAALHDRGQSLTVRHSNDWNSAAQSVREHAVSGLILFGLAELPDPIPDVFQSVPAVWAMGSPRRFFGDKIQPDHSRLGILAAEYLIRHKHLNCAYIGSGYGSPAHLQGYRADGLQWVISQAGGHCELLLDHDVITSTAGQNAPNDRAVAKLVDRFAAIKPRPTALVVQADMLTPSVYRELTARGIRPQKDLLIVTCNNERPYLMSLHPAPIVIDLQGESIGRRAVEQLLWRIDHPNDPYVRIQVEPRLVEA